MNHLKQHIVFRIATLFVVVVLLTPIIVKVSHAFSDHEHEICLGVNQSHFHEIDMDCEFFKYKINHNSYFVFFSYNLKSSLETNISETTYYSFLKSHQHLTSYLRGPPQFLM
ncbi:hypothetical protein [Psychroserpens sp.]|uniref:hypothetical protein n=1 Tax=Psychroserpens sp. TaxID=2020870 RepID=UPI00385F5D8B